MWFNKSYLYRQIKGTDLLPHGKYYKEKRTDNIRTSNNLMFPWYLSPIQPGASHLFYILSIAFIGTFLS